MSHVVKMEVVIKCLPALKRACRQLGLQFNEGATTYRWWGRNVGDYPGANAADRQGLNPADYGKCLHSISVPGASGDHFEIGIVKNPQGEGYVAVYDFYGYRGAPMRQLVREDCSCLAQEYAVAAIEEESSVQDLLDRGWELHRVEQADGSIQVLIEKE